MNQDKLIHLTKEIAKREIDREYESLDVIADWCSSIIEFINRTKPIKPNQLTFDDGIDSNYTCGHCHQTLKFYYQFCPFCGAAIDWGDK